MRVRLGTAMLLLLAGTVTGQQALSSERYLVLATARTKTLRAELDEAVAKGYTLIAGEPASDVLVLEKKPDGAPRRYVVNDRLVSTVRNGEYKGYQILPWSLSSSQYEVGAILESLNEGELQPEYKLSSTAFTRNLQKDLAEASSGGYRAVALTGLNGQAVLLEKSGSVGESPASYQLLATKKISTMEREIADGAARGFRVIAATGTGHEILVLLEKESDPAKKREYRVISTSRTSTFEREINQAAAVGYHVVRGTGAALRKGSVLLGGTYAYEQAIIMERLADTPRVRYLLVGAQREGTIQRELNAAPAECAIATMFLSFQEAIILLACPQQ